jgi:2-polyprenyl-3-methyl-5-hydroxy-6-metoxy-1,4-benzoquinol methylase
MRVKSKVKKAISLEDVNRETFSLDWQFSKSTEVRIEQIVRLVGSNKTVLDIGCYDGRISAKILLNKNKVYGVDVSPVAIKKAQKAGIIAKVFNFEREGVPNSFPKFDIVLAGELIEHILDTDSFVKKVNKVLKKDGFFVITTPNLAGLGSRLSLMLGKMPWMIENDVLPGRSGHIRYFTLDELIILLDRNGFKIDEVVTDTVGIGPNMSIPFISQIFPRLGRSLIIKASKK